MFVISVAEVIPQHRAVGRHIVSVRDSRCRFRRGRVTYLASEYAVQNSLHPASSQGSLQGGRHLRVEAVEVDDHFVCDEPVRDRGREGKVPIAARAPAESIPVRSFRGRAGFACCGRSFPGHKRRAAGRIVIARFFRSLPGHKRRAAGRIVIARFLRSLPGHKRRAAGRIVIARFVT
jgi:hypothetical protein